MDIIIPTLKEKCEVQPLIDEIMLTAGLECRVFATCQQQSASKNRNMGLDWAESEIIIMVDDDISGFSVGWAKKLEDDLVAHKNCVMISPQLYKPDGTPAFMMGIIGRRHKTKGISTAQGHLLTACVAVRKNDLRFDENFIGSGFEDNDYCAQLREVYPQALFLVDHEVSAIHKNECKNQHGKYWDHNKSYFENKWKRYQ